MLLRKRECPLRNTESGQIGWTVGVGFLLFLGVLLGVCMQMEVFRASSQYMEDALAASNLAAAVVDVEEYGISHNLLIASPENAFDLYCAAIKGNLNLDDAWKCPNKGLISGPVCVERFIVYNVVQNTVEVSCVNADGSLNCWQGTLGQEAAPNGITVEHTGIYSEISFQIRGVFGIIVPAVKGKLVDVVGKFY